VKFLKVRDLRSKSAQIWKDLPNEQEMVVTNNGRPGAILSSINESNLEASLNSIEGHEWLRRFHLSSKDL